MKELEKENKEQIEKLSTANAERISEIEKLKERIIRLEKIINKLEEERKRDLKDILNNF